mgnify:CR=1 FL=1
MKTLFILVLSIISNLFCSQEKFDIVTFQPPKNWAKSSTAETLTFSKDDTNGNFCVMTLYKSIEAGNDAKKNFDISWKSLVQEILKTSNAIMQPSANHNGWETQIGSAPFDKEGLKGAAILMTSSKNSKMMNILILTNTENFQKEMETFLESVTFMKMENSNSKPNLSNVNSMKKSTEKPILWANMKYMPKDFYDVTAGTKPITDFYVVYPNGDYLPNAPYEGIINLDKSVQPESWGKLMMNGNKGKFKNNYDEIAVTQKTEIYMEKDGYTHGFHKCLSVDGARLEGFYTHVAPNWGKDPKLNYLDNSGCQFVIEFKKDGTFNDKGIFSTNLNHCSGGKGTYSIENYTITLKYGDGRVVQRLFSAPPTRNISNYDETVFVGGTPYYKKVK